MYTRTRKISQSPLLILLVAVAAVVAGYTAHAVGCPESQNTEASHAFRVAGEFIQKKNWPEAIPSLESALAICPEHENSLRYLGKAYYATERFAEAQAAQEKLVEIVGQDAKPSDYMDLGKTYAKLGENRKARQAYVNASRIEPDNCVILFNLALMHSAVNDYARSVEVYERVVDNCPDLREKAMPYLVKACQEAEQRERSVGNVAEAQLYEAKRSEYGGQAGGSVGYQLIVEKMKAEDWTGTVAQCKAFLANNPESSRRDNVLLNMARSYREVGQTGNAIQTFRDYIAIKSGDGKAAGELIELLAANERCDEALDAAEAAGTRIIDAVQKVYLNYAWGKALECAGRYQEAKEKFRWVVANASGDYKRWAQVEIERQDQYLERVRMQRENAGY
ncbi:tetratricopeptide repeat protein [bacterium]|nr:tetratricopeptide repeat protein [bacterium]